MTSSSSSSLKAKINHFLGCYGKHEIAHILINGQICKYDPWKVCSPCKYLANYWTAEEICDGILLQFTNSIKRRKQMISSCGLKVKPQKKIVKRRKTSFSPLSSPLPSPPQNPPSSPPQNPPPQYPEFPDDLWDDTETDREIDSSHIFVSEKF